MTDQVTHDNEADKAGDGEIYSDLHCYAANDAAFHVLVQAGIKSARIGPNRDLETVAAEIRRSILTAP